MKARRTHSARSHLVGVLALGALAGCTSSSNSSSSSEIPALGHDEVWGITIADPRGDWSECLSDESIVDGLMSLDMPASGVTAIFGPQAREGDVRRVVACLDGSLTSGAVTVTSAAAP